MKKEIPGITSLATNTTVNIIINENKNKIPSFTDLGTTAAHSAVENKIPNVSKDLKW